MTDMDAAWNLINSSSLYYFINKNLSLKKIEEEQEEKKKKDNINNVIQENLKRKWQNTRYEKNYGEFSCAYTNFWWQNYF